MEPTRPASRLEFHVAIFCALTAEADAVCALFDHYWDDEGPQYDKAPGDSNAYSRGSIGRHNVVLVHMPGMGKASSATVAASCRASFPNIKLALVVGICGAVPFTPGSNTEVILGDVIISTGIIQYDFGRRLTERFARKDELLESLGRPNLEIRSLLAKLEGKRDRVRLKTKMASHLDKLQQDPKLEAQYPGAAHDKLFLSTYRHLIDGKTCPDAGCNGELVLRTRFTEGMLEPAVHFGLVASGDAVMKSGEQRDEIAQQEKIIGFEMEGVGVWDNFPCIVIKGACDYADSHKAKVWQSYAAATAAACTKSLLECWMPSVVMGLDGQAGNQDIFTAKYLVPYPRNPDFVGRSDILDLLKDQMGHRHRLRGVQVRLALHGLGGTGKTQIALAYVFWLQDTHPTISIFWVHASNSARFRQAFDSIAEKCQIPGYADPEANTLQLVKDWLECQDHGEWLMVIDNADNADVFFGHSPGAAKGSIEPEDKKTLVNYLPECAHGAFLITTRNKVVGVRLTKGQHPPLEVTRMEKHESEQLLRAKLKGTNFISAELLKLSSQLEHLPLALAQAASFIQENTLLVAEYLQLLSNNDKNTVDLLSEEFESVGQDSEAPRAVAQTWILSFRQLEQQHALASDILSFMSLLDRQDIKLELISYYSENERLGGLENKLALIKALGTLKAFSFITEEKSGSFDMHRLVQLVTRKWLTNSGTISRFSKEALRTISHMYPFGIYETRRTCITYLPHANSVLQLTGSELKNEDETRASLLTCMSGYFFFEGQWKKSEVLLIESVKLLEDLLGVDHPSTVSSLSHLSSTYQKQGRWEEAEKLGMQVMAACKMKLGADHLYTLASMNNLSLMYQNQRRLEEAEKLRMQVIAAYKIKLGADHLYTLTSMGNLALIYQEQGEWKEAEKLGMQVMEAHKLKLGADHPDTLTSMSNLASTYRGQERWEEAEKLGMKVMEARKMKLGADHPDTLTSMNNLALMYQNQRRLKEAEKLGMQVIEACKLKLGADHPDALNSMNNLALVYWKQGRLEEAEKLGMQVTEAYKLKLGADHPDTLSSMGNLALVYQSQGRLEEAEKLKMQVMEARKLKLGADHPGALTSMNNLAITWRRQGRHEEALALMRRSYEGRRQVLGSAHPYTISSQSIIERWES